MFTNFKKNLGQNFLRDKYYLNKIVDCSSFNIHSNLLEIGPGDGALTEYLNNKSKSLTLVEIDNDLIRILSKKFELSKNLILKHKDFLKLNLSEVKKDNLFIFGNLPYNASSQIILKILESDIVYSECIFLIQKELALRFAPEYKKSTKLSMQTKLLANIEILFDVPSTAFEPVPEVTSSVIKITKDKKYIDNSIDYLKFKKILQVCFSHPRKKILFPLKKIFSTVPSFSFSLDKRPEELIINDYLEILNKYEKQI